MDLFSMEFLAALAAIVIIDLVLAGDNAIVIALAARNVPRHQQRKVMIWGAVGAVAVRSVLTLMVVWLLKFPWLMFTGGAMLIWIAYKLLLPEHEGADSNRIAGAASFWGAIRTIVIADTVMGVDNVLGVAGAAHGSFVLVVLGLVISIPILIWGSSILLKYVERYPGLVYLGAGVLAFTAAKMMTSEPAVKDALAAHGWVNPLVYVLCVAGVLWAGLRENHKRLESRISLRLANLKRQWALQKASQPPTQGESAMEKILVPVDGSPTSKHGVRHVMNEARKNPHLEIHLLNVQTPLSRHVSRFVSRKNRQDHHRDEASKALKHVQRMLDAAGISYTTHTAVGRKAEVIASTAQRLQCDHIVMATARKNSFTRMIEASVTNQVLELTTVPVEIIAGDSVSKLERYGIPTGVTAALGLLLLAAAD